MKDFWSWYNKKYGLKDFEERQKGIDIERAKTDINHFADKMLGMKSPFISQKMIDIIKKTEKQKDNIDKMIDGMDDKLSEDVLTGDAFFHTIFPTDMPPISFGHFNCAGDWISPDGTNCGKPFDDKEGDEKEHE